MLRNYLNLSQKKVLLLYPLITCQSPEYYKSTTKQLKKNNSLKQKIL